MPAEVDPPELAHLLDLGERPRVADWSLRAALVRYGQLHPQRISEIMELVRRIDGALKPQQKLLEQDGPGIWAAVGDEHGPAPAHPEVVGLLRAAAALDQLGDRLAAWAVDPNGPDPAAEVDATVTDVAARLDALGVERESRDGPPRGRGRGRG